MFQNGEAIIGEQRVARRISNTSLQVGPPQPGTKSSTIDPRRKGLLMNPKKELFVLCTITWSRRGCRLSRLFGSVDLLVLLRGYIFQAAAAIEIAAWDFTVLTSQHSSSSRAYSCPQSKKYHSLS